MLMVMGKRDNEADLESDAELWARVARSAKPLREGKMAKSGAAKPPAKPAAKDSGPAGKPAPKPTPKPAPAVRGETLSRQTARRLERGHMAVEARFDLHGMRQTEAHAALRRFLKSAQNKGYRHVLVITGKGAESDARRSFYEEERGVLRSSVPHWLAAPDLAHVVLSYTEAPRRLGGEGALFVRLRKGR
jgi:DNA-nicking Smr family endonuclease